MIADRIEELALQRLFFYSSNEIYNAPAGFYDFGPVGVLMKKKIENLWRRFFIKEHGFLEIESTIVTPEIVLKASGHVDEFTDPVVECQRCHRKFRADKIIEEKEGIVWNGDIEWLSEKIKEYVCPVCGGPLGKVKLVNLMFKTEIGYDGDIGFLRPETAQGMFTSFSRIYKIVNKLPLGIGQVGKSFRNEISPRQGLIRLREFTQMELELFIDPESDEFLPFEKYKDVKFRMKLQGAKEPKTMRAKEFLSVIPRKELAFLLAKEWLFYLKVGLNPEKMWFRHLEEGETPHYSAGNVDLEVETSKGIIEIAGNAYRTDYDLSRHQQFSGKTLSVHRGRKFIPHVVEASLGVERLFYVILEHTYRNDRGYEWFAIPKEIAPYDVAVFPLARRKGLHEKAERIAEKLRLEGKDVFYSDAGSIAGRIMKADGIGIPRILVVDFIGILERDRDTNRFFRVGMDM